MKVIEEIETLRARVKVLQNDLASLSANIDQVALDARIRAILPSAVPLQDWAHRSEITGLVLSILRQAPEPMTTREVAIEMLETLVLNPADPRLLRMMLHRVGCALRVQREYGTIRSMQGAGRLVLWEATS